MTKVPEGKRVKVSGGYLMPGTEIPEDISDPIFDDMPQKKEILSKYLAINIRKKRNNLLSESDWTQLNDCPLSNESRTDWAEYRQALRDVPEQADFPNKVIWPTKPE